MFILVGGNVWAPSYFPNTMIIFFSYHAGVVCARTIFLCALDTYQNNRYGHHLVFRPNLTSCANPRADLPRGRNITPRSIAITISTGFSAEILSAVSVLHRISETNPRFIKVRHQQLSFLPFLPLRWSAFSCP